MRFWKSKEEKEFERKQRLRRTKRIINKTIDDCTALRNAYEQNAVDARLIEDRGLTKKFAAKMVLLENHIRKMKSLDLVLRDIELSRNMASSFTSLAEVMKDFTKVMESEKVSARTAAEMSRNLDKILMISEQVDSLFDTVVESMNEKILDADVSDAEIERALRDIEAKAGVMEELSMSRHAAIKRETVDEPRSSEYQDPLDKRIEEGLNKIKKQRKR